MKTFRIPEPEWAQAMFTRLKTMISNLKSSIDGAGYITQETDPTVPAWAKAANKPTYTAQEVGALPANTSIPSKTSDLTNDGDGVSPFVTAADVGAPDMEQAINVLTIAHGGTSSFDATTACDNLGAAHGFVIMSYDVQDISDVQIELDDRLANYVTSGIVKMDSTVWALFTANTRTGNFIGIISHFNDSPNNYSVLGLEHNDTLIYGQVMITNDPSTGETRAFPSLNTVGN